MEIKKEKWRIRYKEGYFYLVKPTETIVYGKTINRRDIYELETIFRLIIPDKATNDFICGRKRLVSKII